MRNAILLLGTLTLMACQKDKIPDNHGGTTTITGASADAGASGVSVEEVRVTLLEHRPASKDVINSVIITNEAGIITMRGRVDDEATHADLVSTVRGMPRVKGVVDQLQVAPKQMMGADQGKMGADQGKMGSDQMGQMQHPGATTTARTSAVKASMMKDRPTASMVINDLMITDDGTTIFIGGIVPDEATHQALLKSAQKTTGVKNVQDELKVKGN